MLKGQWPGLAVHIGPLPTPAAFVDKVSGEACRGRLYQLRLRLPSTNSLGTTEFHIFRFRGSDFPEPYVLTDLYKQCTHCASDSSAAIHAITLGTNRNLQRNEFLQRNMCQTSPPLRGTNALLSPALPRLLSTDSFPEWDFPSSGLLYLPIATYNISGKPNSRPSDWGSQTYTPLGIGVASTDPHRHAFRIGLEASG